MPQPKDKTKIQEWKNKISEKLKKYEKTKEHKKNISKSHLGKKTTQETIRKLKKSCNGINLAEKNGNWKGDKVKLRGLHRWIESRKFKPKLCEKCKRRKPRELSNTSGNYLRDINDFEWLCSKCHFIKDGKIEKLKLIAGKHLIGKKYSDIHRENISKSLKGIKFTKKHKKNISKSQKKKYKNGYINPMKNKKRNDLSEYNKRRKGKTFEEIYGFDKAQEIKNKLSNALQLSENLKEKITS